MGISRIWGGLALTMVFALSCSRGGGGGTGTAAPPATPPPPPPSVFSVGGTLTGLAPGDTVWLQNDAATSEVLAVTQPGPFEFLTLLDPGEAYQVSILSQPVSGTCTVVNGAGVMPVANVSDVVVQWTPTATLLLGTDVQSPAILRSIDPQSGSTTALSGGFLPAAEIDAAALTNPNNAYFVSNEFGYGGARLFEVYRFSGTVTSRGTIPQTQRLTGLCQGQTYGGFFGYNPTTGEIIHFGVTLGQISVPTFVAFTGAVDGQALALDPGSGELFVFDAGTDQVLGFDPVTGAPTGSAQLPAGMRFTAATILTASGPAYAFSDADGQLYEVDPQSGTTVPIGATGVPSIGGLTVAANGGVQLDGFSGGIHGVRFDVSFTATPGVLLAKTVDTTGTAGIVGMAPRSFSTVFAATEDVLAHLDKSTGSLHPVGEFAPARGFRSLARHPITGELYGVQVVSGAADMLHGIDSSTAATTLQFALTNPELDVQAACFDSIGDVLYLAAEGLTGDVLLKIQFSGGAPAGTETVVGAIGHDRIRGMTWNGITHSLHAVSQSSQAVVDIDPATGIGTALGALAFDFEALAVE